MYRFAVTDGGWEADVEVENRTGIAWEMERTRLRSSSRSGSCSSPPATLDEVEQRSGNADLPGLRPAQVFVPPLPSRLAPEGRWRGTVSAHGTLASGRYVRVVFGPLIALGDAPDGMPSRFVWITDHAYRLRP